MKDWLVRHFGVLLLRCLEEQLKLLELCVAQIRPACHLTYQSTRAQWKYTPWRCSRNLYLWRSQFPVLLQLPLPSSCCTMFMHIVRFRHGLPKSVRVELLQIGGGGTRCINPPLRSARRHPHPDIGLLR